MYNIYIYIYVYIYRPPCDLQNDESISWKSEIKHDSFTERLV